MQAPPGVPVGSLVASGEIELGFQQLSELMSLPGIDVLGPLPDEIQIITTFSAGVPTASRDPETVRSLLDFACARLKPRADQARQRHGAGLTGSATTPTFPRQRAPTTGTSTCNNAASAPSASPPSDSAA